MGLSPNLSPSAHPENPINLGVTYREELGGGVELFVAPRHVVSWADFVKAAPPYSIGLDGYIRGAPRFDPDGPYLNLNHHEDVDRLGTRSTCSQVHMNMKQGLMEAFRRAGLPCMRVFVNDPDQDVSLSVWLLQNHERVAGSRSEPLINRLVQAEDLLDATAGAYPFDPNSNLARELNWIFEPYNQSRASGKLFLASGAEMAAIIAAVGERIHRYSLGHGQQLPLDLRLERLGGGPGWALIREIGSAARTNLYQSGCQAFVSVSEVGDGRYKYSIGKMSAFVPFPLTELYDVLNEAEGIPPHSSDRWGGGDMIGGSPRIALSRLSPSEVERIINSYLSRRQFQSGIIEH